MTVNDVVEIYHTSKPTVYRLKKRGILPFFKIGNQLRFWPEDVEAALTGTQPPVAPAAERAKLLSPEDIAFLSELAAAAPTLSEEQRDVIRAAFRDGGAPPPPAREPLPRPVPRPKRGRNAS
jgi:excisionase family DNA binding protein